MGHPTTQISHAGQPVSLTNPLPSIGLGGHAEVAIIRPANTTAYTAGDVIGIGASVSQVETATASGTITAGTAQVETATASGTITDTGNALVTVSCAAFPDSADVVLSVPVLVDDTASDWADKVRTALAADPIIAGIFTVSGSTTAIVLTRNVPKANDATLNIALANGTCTGIDDAATSTDTTAGVASGEGAASVIVTGAGIADSPVQLSVPVAAGDTAATWAGKVRTALAANAAITALYTVGGSTTAITLTRTVPAANDSTLNIALANGTCTGINAAASSANTTAGATTSATAGSAILEFAFGSAWANREVYITDLLLTIPLSSIPSGMTSFRLETYNASPTAILDNAAWDLVTGDQSRHERTISGIIPTDRGSTLKADPDSINKRITLDASGSFFAELITEGGFTPASGTVYTLKVYIVAA